MAEQKRTEQSSQSSQSDENVFNIPSGSSQSTASLGSSPPSLEEGGEQKRRNSRSESSGELQGNSILLREQDSRPAILQTQAWTQRSNLQDQETSRLAVRPLTSLRQELADLQSQKDERIANQGKSADQRFVAAMENNPKKTAVALGAAGIYLSAAAKNTAESGLKNAGEAATYIAITAAILLASAAYMLYQNHNKRQGETQAPAYDQAGDPGVQALNRKIAKIEAAIERIEIQQAEQQSPRNR